jgi:hypothetical protein
MSFPAVSLNGDGSMSHAANSATTNRTALSSETTTRTHARRIDLTRQSSAAADGSEPSSFIIAAQRLAVGCIAWLGVSTGHEDWRIDMKT